MSKAIHKSARCKAEWFRCLRVIDSKRTIERLKHLVGDNSIRRGGLGSGPVQLPALPRDISQGEVHVHIV